MNNNSDKKRKHESEKKDNALKKRKQWRAPKKSCSQTNITTGNIEPGDAGIWITCARNKESQCTAELNALFNEYTTTMYNNVARDDNKFNDEEGNADGIEEDIRREVEALQKSKRDALLFPVKIDTQCVLFFKARQPVDPVSIVHRICSDAFESLATTKHRYIQRMTPVSKIGKATERGLDEVAQVVLFPVFNKETPPKKFAIRTTIRNHNVMERDSVIKQVANIVGARHSVDLKNYDLLILVEIYRNTCGMSVVGSDFEKLKRYNLTEIYHPQSAERH